MKQFWSSFLCLMALLVVSLTPTRAQEPLPWLRTDGARIVNAQNQQVVLGGVNLGGWLVEEMWMMPFQIKPPEGWTGGTAGDHVTLWHVVEKRLGNAEMNRVRNALRASWITEADFGRIKAAGMNCVRLPFTYDLLDEPGGWERIDKSLNWARQNHLYVILDLHGAPGRQSGYDHTGEAGIDQFFKDPANLAKTEAVWTRIAQRYKNRPEVAGYDMLNEPVSAPDIATLYVMQDRLYRAIRAVDDRHIVFIEDGYKGRDSFPRPALSGWKNVALSWHHYRFDAKSADSQADGLTEAAQAGRRLARSHNAPFFLGEFQIEPNGNPDVLKDGLTQFQQGAISWTIWTYKTLMPDGGGGMWGWRHAKSVPQVIDPYRDTAQQMVDKLAQVKTENMAENKAMTAVFKAAATVKPLPPAQVIVPTAAQASETWSYTTAATVPAAWFTPSFDAGAWQKGTAGFGAEWTFAPPVRTRWKTDEIYLRREFTLPEGVVRSSIALMVCHDDDAEVYINGVLAARLPGYSHEYQEVALTKEGLAALKPGKNLLAVHCHQGAGGQFIDAGFVGVLASSGDK